MALGTADQELTIVLKMKNEIDAALKKADDQVRGFEKTLKNNEKTFKSMAVAGAAAFAVIAVGVNKAIGKARDFEEESNKFSVVFKDVSVEAQKMADTLNKSYGLSILESKQLLSATGDILTGFGFTGEAALDLSSRVNTLSVDLASFTNAQGGAEAVSSALTRALLGERESLKTYGIAILDTDVKAELLAQGMSNLTGEALRQASAQVTLDLIYRQSKNSVGDYARSAGTLTQTQKELAKSIEDAQIAIGTTLAPVLNSILKSIVPVISRFGDWIKENPKLTQTIIVVSGVVAGLVGIIGSLGLILPKVISLLRTLWVVMAANPILAAIGVAVGAVSIQFVKFADQVGGFSKAWGLWMISLLEEIQRFGRGALQVINAIIGWIPGIGTALDSAISYLDGAISNSQERFSTLFNQGVEGSKELGVEAPKAYAAITSAAEDTAKKIEAANKQIAETDRQMKDLMSSTLEGLTGDRQSAAEAYVAQEQKVKDLRKQMRQEDDDDAREKLQEEYDRQKKALDDKSFMENTLGESITEARRRNRLTDFEREMEDIANRSVARTTEFMEKMSLLQEELKENIKKRDAISSYEAQTTANVLSEVNKREKETVGSINRQISAYKSLEDASSGGKTKSVSFSGVDFSTKTSTPAYNFEHGGTVPGAVGTPVAIMAHGQERIIPASQTKSNNGGGQTVTVNIINPVVKDQNAANRLRVEIDGALRDVLRVNKTQTA